MRIFSLFIPLFLALSVGFAQQRPQYTQYITNAFLINPALAGVNTNIVVKAGYRTQWVGFEGAPKTYFVSVNSPINRIDDKQALRIRKKLNHHGIGGYLFKDEIGPTSTQGFYFSYAFHLALTKSIKSSMGFSAGLMQHGMSADKIILSNPVDNTIASIEPAEMRPDGAIGIWVYNTDFFFGFVVNQVLAGLMNTSLGDGQILNTNLTQHYFLHAGYNFQINRDWYLVPSILVKSIDPVYTQFDANIKLRYKQQVWAGLSYREDDAIAGMIGITDNKLGFNISYSYDFTTSNIRFSSAGSHEIVLGINLAPKGKVLCPDDYW